ncbi:ATP-binding cassette domain-containing protein [Rhodobacteraceae bacterium CCMM004]|nr:ATP-binding cassette domain-containing protein [Rhodobacteraceae bacterium CCMM004]
MDEGLSLDRVQVRLNGRVLLSLDLAVAPGTVTSVMGPSGSGKSTLLGAVMGTLSAPFEVLGRIRLDGADLSGRPPEARGIGILFQDDLLFPHLSVGANLAFGLPPGLRGRAARRAAVDAALSEIGMAGFAARDPGSLSGGQKIRVALMRTLLSEPRALLLDEPFSSLDADLRAQMRTMVFARARARTLPVLMVTHDAEDAAAADGPVLRLG